LRTDRKECSLDDKVLRQKELDEVRSIKNFHDLLQVNLSSGWSVTLFQWPMPDDDRFNIAMERYRIFVQIDYPALFEKAQKLGFT